MKVKNLVDNSYKTSSPYIGVISVEKVLIDNGYIVVKEHENYIGILTPFDIIMSPHMLVIDCLHDRPRLNQDDTVEEAIGIMNKTRNDVLPVFRDNTFIGVVKQTDITEFLHEYEKNLELEVAERTRELSSLNDQLRSEMLKTKKLDEYRNRAERIESIGTLAGGIAHDFNNLLTVILSNISLARMHAQKIDGVDQPLIEAEKASTQAKELSDRLISLAPGGAPIMKAEDISDTVKRSAGSILAGSDISFSIDIEDGLYSVQCDINQIHQMIRNLTINAKEAVSDKGTIDIELKNEQVDEDQYPDIPVGNYINFSIRDNGKGIKPADLSKIFNPYFTTKQSSTQKGLGIGLALAYSIIKRHNGYIHVKSAQDNGTCFRVHLPVYLKAEINIENPGHINKSLHVLIMDDEKMIRDVVSKLLKRIGHDAELAKDGKEAIELYIMAREKKTPFDLVILDMVVPNGMDGVHTIERLLSIDPGVKALASSGYTYDHVLSNYREYGFCGIIKKPYTLTELKQAISFVLSS